MAKQKKQEQQQKRVVGRSVLWVLAALFLASSALRLIEPGMAIARGAADAPSEPITETKECQTEEDIATVLAMLSEREAGLLARESALKDRIQALAVSEAQIEKNMKDLIAAEEGLRATLAIADGAAETDLSQLTQVYESMKPKQAIPLFAQMDPQFAAGFLGRMQSNSAAQIMAGLDPQKAYAISVILAGRNANVPTN